MAKKAVKKEAETIDPLFVLGLDESGKPRGARFAELKDKTVSAAMDLKLSPCCQWTCEKNPLCSLCMVCIDVVRGIVRHGSDLKEGEHHPGREAIISRFLRVSRSAHPHRTHRDRQRRPRLAAFGFGRWPIWQPKANPHRGAKMIPKFTIIR